MRCPTCTFENREGARFCAECGSELELTCPSCGASAPPASKFCDACGAKLDASSAPGASSGRTPDAYTPSHLAQKIVQSRAALEGERKQVTVLFADIVGSTRLIDGMDPEEAMRRLQPALDAMMAAVHQYEGTVNRVQGDGIMALFGAPIAHEDHAVRACLAALAMQDAVQQANDEALTIRVGLNSGEVVVRAIRNDLTMEYEAEGPTVHLAARMEQLADPGTVRVTGQTFRLAEGFVQCNRLEPVPVKGLNEPVAQLELTGSTTARTRWEARAFRGLSRFVGRETELAGLARALERAATGHGQLVAVVGEPGMGKSRLVHEFLQLESVRDWAVRLTGAVSHGANTPYLPVSNLLRSVLGVDDLNTQANVAAKLRENLRALDEQLLRLLPPLFSLLDLPVEDPEWFELDPKHRRRQLLDAVKALALRRSESVPLLLVFEDLHWIDPETQAVLDNLVEALGAARILLLVTYRPEYRHPWSGKTYYTGLHLDALSGNSARDLVIALLGADPGLSDLQQLLIERTEGRPLFMEETVRSLVENGAIEGQPGNYRLARRISEIEIPVSVQSVLASRIDRLAPDHKRILQVASVIGRRIPLALLKSAGDFSDDVLQAGLAELQAGEYLFEAQTIPEVEYVFKHALIERGAYDGLLESQRQTLHARVVGAMEGRFRERLDEHVELLGQHALNGQLWDKAFGYLRRAGNKAVERSAYREGVAFFEQALTALEESRQSDDVRRRAVDTRLEMRPALGALGEYGPIYERLLEAEKIAESIGDHHRLARVNADKTHVLYQLGELVEAIRAGEAAVTLARDVEDRRMLIQSSCNLGMAYFFHGEFQRAIDSVLEYTGELEGSLRHERLGSTGTSACNWLGNIAAAYTLRGEFDRAIRFAEEASAIADESKKPFDFYIANVWLGFALVAHGKVGRATRLLDQLIETTREHELGFGLAWSAGIVGDAYILSGRAQDARVLLEEALALARNLRLSIAETWCTTSLCSACLETGDLQEAQSHGQTAFDIARRREYRWSELVALRLLGRICLSSDSDRLGQAERHFLDAMELARALQAAPDLAHVCYELGTLLSATNRGEEARSRLREAVDLYRAMGMEFWLPRAEAALADTTRTKGVR